MTAWHVAQLAIAFIAIAQLARSARSIAWRAPSDARALVDAAAIALSARQAELARALVSACQPAWTAQILTAGLAGPEGETPREAMNELCSMLVTHEADRLRTVGALGRIAGPLAFLAIVLELAAAFGPGHGLAALQRGLVESIAIGHAALSFAIGLSTMMACTLGATFLRERLRALTEELKRAREALIRVLEPTPDM